MAIDIRTIALGGDSQMTFDEEGRLRLGPRRIIPLSYLGYCYPGIRDELRRLYEDRHLLPPRTNAEFWIRVGGRIEDGPDELGDAILKEVTGTPLSLFQLAKRTGGSMSDVMRGVSTLERRGLVQRSGLTPTDLLHLTGIFQAWDRESADWGMRLLSDRWKMELPAVGEQLEGAMNRMIGRQILDLLLSESIDATTGLDGCAFCNLFLDEALRRSGRVTGVQFGIQVKEKLIGIGAPAHAFLPSVAEKLETQVVIPFYAGVANAIGAITSAIVIQEELFIKPYLAGYRLFSSAGLSFHHDLGEATEAGHRLLRTMTLEKAREAGADEPEVFIDEKETWTTARGGETVFIEKQLTARAVGNPRIVQGAFPSESNQNHF
jgi:N-methylhydantoinase A/oxoprolinase/acetone carboxylase beta subunit